MKRILVLIIVLLTAIITMAYLYFSGLNAEKKNNDGALYASCASSAVIFAFQNDRSILETLNSQPLLFEIIGEEKIELFKSLNKFLLQNPTVNKLIDRQNIYLGLIPGRKKNVDFLFHTQLNSVITNLQLKNVLKSARIKATAEGEITKLILGDSSIFYLRYKNKLLQLSSNREVIRNSLVTVIDNGNKFADYIVSTNKLTKSSLAEVYINYHGLPDLLKVMMPGKLNGELLPMDHQDAFSTLAYNYSTGHILFNGSSRINDNLNYYQLYSGAQSVKTTINNILPQNTANYTIFTINNYSSWHKSLDNWFSKREQQKKAAILNRVREEYHLDPEQTLPKYFKNQLVTFQLGTGEKLGAIDLSNGEKLERLLLDLSTNYSDEIKALKVSGLLFAYFGEPFRKFNLPYYTIIDNYMVFANNASSIQAFLNSYKNSHLLLANAEYTGAVNKLPNSSAITFYVDLHNSSEIILRNLYLPYYRHITSGKNLGNYSSFIFQLTGEKTRWQTNVLLNRKTGILLRDSLRTEIDSLAALH